MSVEHIGHVAAAVDRRTSSTPSRAARAASAPTDNDTTCSSSLPSPPCSSLPVDEHGGGEAVLLEYVLSAVPPPPAAPPASRPSRAAADRSPRASTRTGCGCESAGCYESKVVSGAGPWLCACHDPQVVALPRAPGRVHPDERAALDRARCTAAPCERRPARRDRVDRVVYGCRT